MSTHEVIDFECPECKTKSRVTVWRSLNATQDPEARKQLLEGKLNFFACANCAQKGYLLTSFLYHDMERKFLVQFHPYPAVNDPEFLEQFEPSGRVKLDPTKLAEKPGRRLDYFSDIRLVFDMAELIRYIVFRERLSDLKTRHKDTKVHGRNRG
jgi:hypothetical protein